MSLRRPRIRVYLAIFVTIALGFLLPPAISLKHFRAALSQSLSRSLGRQATVQDVHLRLLPLPGFTFRRLRISDDEEFGAEPILQTQEDGQSSAATLRLTSLWRGRLEIASISLTQASLNLVRAPDGHWNLERLINRAAQVPSAPTSKKEPEARTRFPYIELKESRINFKSGPEKKPFTLSEAEFALWLAAENRWNVRLKAVPLRTDESISDTGVIRLSGSFDRANQFAQTPFHFQVSWDRPEVNAITRIARGDDPGWRGAADLNAELKGTPSDFFAHFTGNIDEFRRYDIARNSSFNVRVICDNHFRADGLLSDLNNNFDFRCKLPLEPGAITAQGKLHLFHGSSDFSVRLFASELPIADLIQAMLHAKSTLPNELSGEGVVDGTWTIEGASGTSVVWKGAITATHAALHAATLERTLVFPESVTLNFEPPPKPAMIKGKSRTLAPPAFSTKAMLRPFTLDLGGETQVSGSFDTAGYRININGPVEWQRMIQVTRAIGLHPPTTDLAGAGVINAQYSGEWRHFAPPTVSGQAQIRHAVLSLRGFSEPLRVSAGTVKFDGANFQADKIEGSFPRNKLTFLTSFSGTRQCERHIICDVSFSLQASELQDRSLLTLLNTSSPDISLPFFDSGHAFDAKWLLEIPATGSISAQHLQIRNLQARNASAELEIAAGKVLVHHWTADLFDGKHDGDWTFDFSGPRPTMIGVGTIRKAQMYLVRAALDEHPGTGTIDLDYRLAMNGSSLDQLAATVAGSGSFSWRDGLIQTVNPDADEPVDLSFGLWTGQFTFEKQRITLQNTRMDSPSGMQEVSGEISFDRPWNLRLLRTVGNGFVAADTAANPPASHQKTSVAEAQR